MATPSLLQKGGNAKHPGWYHNLKAQGEVKVQVAEDIFQASTRIAADPERQTVWDQMAAMYPPFEITRSALGIATFLWSWSNE